MNTLVKICGIRSRESAEAALQSGADFLGFIFVPDSKRYIKPETAKPIIDKVRKNIKIVGVFKNLSIEEVNQISQFLGLDYVQLHGEESVEFGAQVNTRVIKAFPLKSDFDVNEVREKMKMYKADYFLLDRKKQGEGEILDLERGGILSSEFPVIFAGGLTPGNVAKIIEVVRPYAVDVVSGIETDGTEDLGKIKKFIENTKEVAI